MDKQYLLGDAVTEVTKEEIRELFQYALNTAKSYQVNLTVVVNSLRNCDSFIKAWCEDNFVSKLKMGETLQYEGVEITLKSRDGIKEFNDYGVIYGIHLSVDSLEVVMKRAKVKSIILIENPIEKVISWLNLNEFVQIERNA